MDIKQKLLAAVEEANKTGKEPFDFAKFTQYYLHDRGSDETLTPNAPASVQHHYYTKYYLFHPEIKTIQEFADFLNQIDQDS